MYAFLVVKSKPVPPATEPAVAEELWAGRA
jgi:hypothetical protein